MVWANFLHMYQPPVQTTEILQRVTNESYRKILDGLLRHPTAKVTININACLTEMLARQGFSDVIENLRILLERGQIEMTGSAKFHPFLPKLSRQDMTRQIQQNTETNRKYFGERYQPKGFFPPEMAYQPSMSPIIQNLGFSWIILDEYACPATLDHTKRYRNSDGMQFYFRERNTSFKILSAQLGTGEQVIQEFSDRINKNEYALTAMDAETFGHHRLGLEQVLEEVYESSALSTVTISDLPSLFPETIQIEPVNSTWALTPKDIVNNVYYSRWNNPDNPIHQKQWELTDLALKLMKAENQSKQTIVDRAIYSDQYWWASAKPWWSLEMIERGAFELLSAIQQFEHCRKEDKQRAQDLYYEIITLGFAWQRDGTVNKMSQQEDEEIVEHMRKDQPKLSTADFEQMIRTLEQKMLESADNREYTRAESFQKRMRQLQSEMEKNTNTSTNEILVNQ